MFELFNIRRSQCFGIDYYEVGYILIYFMEIRLNHFECLEEKILYRILDTN